MILGIDLDSTLVDLPVVSRISEEIGLSYTDSDFHNWDFSPLPPVYLERAKELFSDPLFMCTLEPYDGAREKLKEWKLAGHKLVLITARSPKIHKQTISMVNELFPEIDTIDFVDIGASKKDLFKKYKLDRWIDDSPHETKNALSLGIKTYMISNETTTYNHNISDFPDTSKLSIVDSVANIKNIEG